MNISKSGELIIFYHFAMWMNLYILLPTCSSIIREIYQACRKPRRFNSTASVKDSEAEVDGILEDKVWRLGGWIHKLRFWNRVLSKKSGRSARCKLRSFTICSVWSEFWILCAWRYICTTGSWEWGGITA